jgi:UDP-2-acetamido-3-amino-2,3-dideoxy-glucuronate N-acetyltransferase
VNVARNIAVIGTGYWGKNLVRNFYNLDSLHTICDSNPDQLETFLAQYKGIKGVTSYSEVLQNPEIQGIVVATPAETHFALASEALLAGKDVYVEKPLCLSEQDGEELNELADKHEKILMTGHLLWYHPAVNRLDEMIQAGELGRLQYLYSNRLNLGKLRREENVLWSFAPHDISVILGLLGEMPSTIQAQGGNYLHQQIADTTVTMLDFPSGVKAHIFVSWLHPFKEQKLVVVGDKQMVVFDDTAPWPEKLCLYPHSVQWSGNIPVADRAQAIPVELEEDEPLKAECLHFLKSIEKIFFR